MIIATDLNKSFDGQRVLGPVNVVCHEGATTVLLGQSGCGKSTLLRLFMGLLWPDSGSVRIGDDCMTPANARQLRHEMGYLTQDGGLFPHLTVRDNILLAARCLGREHVAGVQLEPLLAMTKLSADLLTRYPAELSGGQRQRVGLMRALILNPRYILLDEPMGALDPMIRKELQCDLKAIFRSLRKTVVLVTHDLAEAAFLGDLVVLMRDGLIVQQGDFASLVHTAHSQFVTDFIGAQRPAVWPAASYQEESCVIH